MFDEIFRRGKARSELVVVLHGLRSSPKQMLGVVGSVAAARPDADILALPLAFAGPLGIFAVQPAEHMAAKVVERINAAIKAREEDRRTSGTYQRFVLVGHSFGGVIARKVAIIANGQKDDAPFEPLLTGFQDGTAWGTKIERIVLLAGMSRGWSPASARDWSTAAGWTLGSWLSEFLSVLSRGRLRPTPNTRSGIRQIFEGAVAASNSGYGRSAEKKCSPRAFLSVTHLRHTAGPV
jgi:pimeloyl-ACP methyl ester carboxylesterase